MIEPICGYRLFKCLTRLPCMQWDPPTLPEVTSKMVDRIFAPFEEEEKESELNLPVQEREGRPRGRARM